MADEDVILAVAPLVDVLERLGIDYLIGGSVASSFHGVPRSTIDVDLVADLPGVKVAPLAAALQADYYADVDMMRDAVRRRASFNLVHYATALKIDVYLLKTRAFERESFARRRSGALTDEGDGRRFQVESPEDVVLHKLEWYRLGGEVADRQWTDVLGVLKLKHSGLDLEYMRRWATEIGVDDLLERALRAAC